ncbi:thioredoxin domain-containing protein, partial [Streptomyces sp. SID13588]|uniref:thioredoxin family protein n=1 Tax=Streptomyces sp. SID13588 TaxID=2706051 RepID=UPI0013C7AE6A
AIAEEHGDQIEVVKLNIDENPATAAKYGVMSIPTLNVYQNGEVAKTIVGTKPKAAIVRDLADFIGEEVTKA